MRDRLVALINEAKDEYPTLPSVNCCKPTFAYYLADRLLAGGAIFPPCKVGDTVYYINLYSHIMLYKDRVYEAAVSRIAVTKLGVSVAIIVHGGHAVNEIPEVEFGKNVFFTREEAEQALRKEKT